jgi:hypothetical protein
MLKEDFTVANPPIFLFFYFFILFYFFVRKSETQRHYFLQKEKLNSISRKFSDLVGLREQLNGCRSEAVHEFGEERKKESQPASQIDR